MNLLHLARHKALSARHPIPDEGYVRAVVTAGHKAKKAWTQPFRKTL